MVKPTDKVEMKKVNKALAKKEAKKAIANRIKEMEYLLAPNEALLVRTYEELEQESKKKKVTDIEIEHVTKNIDKLTDEQIDEFMDRYDQSENQSSYYFVRKKMIKKFGYSTEYVQFSYDGYIESSEESTYVSGYSGTISGNSVNVSPNYGTTNVKTIVEGVKDSSELFFYKVVKKDKVDEVKKKEDELLFKKVKESKLYLISLEQKNKKFVGSDVIIRRLFFFKFFAIVIGLLSSICFFVASLDGESFIQSLIRKGVGNSLLIGGISLFGIILTFMGMIYLRGIKKKYLRDDDSVNMLYVWIVHVSCIIFFICACKNSLSQIYNTSNTPLPIILIVILFLISFVVLIKTIKEIDACETSASIINANRELYEFINNGGKAKIEKILAEIRSVKIR